MLAFIDESGKPHPSDSCSCSVLTAICFSEKDSAEISRNVYNLKNSYLGNVLELKANKILNERTMRRIPTKKAFLDALFAWLAGSPPLHIFAVIMPRPSNPPVESPGYLSMPYRFLLMRVQACLREHYPNEKGILVFDTQDAASDLHISRSFSNFLFRSPEGRNYDLLDTPFFVDSRTAHGIQLADIAAGVIRNYFEGGLGLKETHSEFEARIVQYHQIIRSNTKNFRAPEVPDFNDDILFGMYTMPEKWFYV